MINDLFLVRGRLKTSIDVTQCLTFMSQNCSQMIDCIGLHTNYVKAAQIFPKPADFSAQLNK